MGGSKLTGIGAPDSREHDKSGEETPNLRRTSRIRRLVSVRGARKWGSVCPSSIKGKHDDNERVLGGGQVTGDNCLGTAPPSYLCVVGYNWAVALAWNRAFPSEPFLGIRVDSEEVWVVFEPKTATGPIPRSVFEQVTQAFEDAGAASIDDSVFIHEAPSIGAAHRLARRVATILHSGPYRRPLTRPLVSMSPTPSGQRASRWRSIQLGLFD
jgi:hypothetical protein